MDNIETWAKLFTTYGPPAFVLFLILVAAAQLGRALQNAAPSDRPLFQGLYVLNWLVALGLVVFSAYAWATGNLVPSGCKATLVTIEGDAGAVRKLGGVAPDDVVVRQHPPQLSVAVARDGHFILQGVPLARGEVMPSLDFESKSDDYDSTQDYQLNAENAHFDPARNAIRLTVPVTIQRRLPSTAPLAPVGALGTLPLAPVSGLGK